MANSFLNRTFRSAQAVSPLMASVTANSPASSFPVFNWALSTSTSTCVEKPAPPAEEQLPPDPQPRQSEEDAPLETSDIIIPRDDRERPGITSKTTSVGKKVIMIDHNSFYAYNPNNEFDTIPWSEGVDPIRFLLGRLWTQNPPPHMLGENNSLYGKGVIFGHKVMEKNEDWVKQGDQSFKVFKDPPKVRDIRSGKVITEYNNPRDPNTRKTRTGKTSIFNEKLGTTGRQAMKRYYSALFDNLPSGQKPIFCDLAEYGVMKLQMNPAAMLDAEGSSRNEIYRRLIFGGSRDYAGKAAASHTYPEILQYSPIGNTGGLFRTISKQQQTHGTYSDHSFEMSTPISASSLEHYAALRRPQTAKIDPVYNFYCKEYESVTSGETSQMISEHALPNIYTFMTEKYSEKIDYFLSVNITNFLRLNPTRDRRKYTGEHKQDRIQGFFVDKVKISPSTLSRLLPGKRTKEGETSTGLSYFKKWGNTALSMISDRSWEVYENNYSNYKKQTFPHSEDKMYLNIKETKTSFPMLVDINFSTDKMSPIGDAIARSKLDCYLGCYLFGYESQSYSDALDSMSLQDSVQGKHKMSDYLGYIEAQQFILTDAAQQNPTVVSNLYTNIPYSVGGQAITNGRKCYDFEDWLRSIGGSPLEVGDKMFFGESDSLELLDQARASTGDVLALLKVYLASRVKKLITDEGKFRDLEQVYNGKLCYNETLMYKVEKYKFDDQGSEVLVSQFLIPNKSETENITLTDTQIKYDNLYYYRVKSINLVIGNEYFFVFPDDNEIIGSVKGYSRKQLKRAFDTEGVCKLNYCNYPSLKIVEAPYYNEERTEAILTRVVDCPPVPPMVKVDVYKDDSTRVHLSLNSAVGDYIANPTMISSADATIIEKVQQNQRNEIASLEKNDISQESISKIRFKSDDPISSFEIYRTEKFPIDYTGFKGALRTVVQTRSRFSSGAFIDDISPNVKYYYTFRSIDIHGYFSNPTMVYEVEIVRSNGLSYPIIRVFYPGESIKTPKEPVRDLNKFLEIRPNLEDAEINYEKSGLDGIKNMIQSNSNRNKKISSVFPTERSDFKSGRQYILGNPDDIAACWGKTFKVRLTSKQSGRKLDLNIRFKYTDSVDGNDFYINRE